MINGLSDREHPCQALGDLLTIYEHERRLEGVRLAFVGDGNNVANSLLLAGGLMGLHVTVISPPGFAPAPEVLERATRLGRDSGGSARATPDLGEIENVDVVYTDVWASMGQESEADARKEAFRPYQVNEALMKRARPRATLLHCLPAHYGEEIDYATSRREGSAIFDEAENRQHVEKALMCGWARRAEHDGGDPGGVGIDRGDTNNAAGVLMFPIAMAVAQVGGVSYLPYVIAVMVGASAGFITPIGYQTNLMVYGPGGYRWGDYIRFGTPLSIIVGIATVLIVPRVWPF